MDGIGYNIWILWFRWCFVTKKNRRPSVSRTAMEFCEALCAWKKTCDLQRNKGLPKENRQQNYIHDVFPIGSMRLVYSPVPQMIHVWYIYLPFSPKLRMVSWNLKKMLWRWLDTLCSSSENMTGPGFNKALWRETNRSSNLGLIRPYFSGLGTLGWGQAAMISSENSSTATRNPPPGLIGDDRYFPKTNQHCRTVPFP